MSARDGVMDALISRSHVLAVLDMANADERLREAVMGLPKVEVPTRGEVAQVAHDVRVVAKGMPEWKGFGPLSEDVATANAILALLTPGGDPSAGSRP